MLQGVGNAPKTAPQLPSPARATAQLRRVRRAAAASSSQSPPPAPSPAAAAPLLACRLAPLGAPFEFPHRGSGLLWARSTGLKLWPGAVLLARATAEDDGRLLAGLLPGGADGWRGWAGAAALELGCGLGLVSAAAARLGARAVATDGDADLVRVTARNLKHNAAAAAADAALPAVAVLPWGDERALAAALAKLPPPPLRDGSNSSTSSSSSEAAAEAAAEAPTTPLALDAVLLSDVVYGSDPGQWEKLVATLRAACGPRTLVLQAETRRLEGRLYHEVRFALGRVKGEGRGEGRAVWKVGPAVIPTCCRTREGAAGP